MSSEAHEAEGATASENTGSSSPCSGGCGSDCGCKKCSAKSGHGFVYALGSISPRFPSVGIEKEFIQATGRENLGGMTDRQATQAVLSKAENRYLVRRLCWVFSVAGMDAYILLPRDPADYSLLVDTLRRNPSSDQLDAVVGVRGEAAPPEACNGLRVPMLAFDNIYSFDRESLIASIPRPKEFEAHAFGPVAAEILDHVLQRAQNTGSSDEDRALNYLALRYPAIYAQAALSHHQNFSLRGISVRPTAVTGARRIVDVIFEYRNRATDLEENFFARVDVTEEFPFLVSRLSRCY